MAVHRVEYSGFCDVSGLGSSHVATVVVARRHDDDDDDDS
jgi:hypothetical protein